MHYAYMRAICSGVAALAIGAGAGYAFLHMFAAAVSAPPSAAQRAIVVPAASPTLEPGAPAGPQKVRNPQPITEPPPRPPGRIRYAVTEGMNTIKPAPPRGKITSGIPRVAVDEETIADAIGELRVPMPVGKLQRSW